MRAATCLVDFEGPAVQHRCSPGRTTSQANSGNAASAREARQTAPSWPNPRPSKIWRQGNDLRATAPTASGRYADSTGALRARVPSRASSQDSRSRRVVLILEHHLRSCDELHVARRDAQAAAPAHSKKRRYRMACRANDVFARSSRPMERLDPPRGRTGAVSAPGRRRARHLQREPPRLRGAVDFGAAPLAAERAGRRRRGRGGAPGLRAALGRPREAERPRLGRSCAPRAPTTAPRRRPQSQPARSKGAGMSFFALHERQFCEEPICSIVCSHDAAISPSWTAGRPVPGP